MKRSITYLCHEGDDTPSQKKRKSAIALIKAQDNQESSSDVEQTFESFTAAEIQESQEFTSQPGTPVSGNIAFSPKSEGLPSEREKNRSLSLVSTVSGSKAFSPSGGDSISVGQPSDGQATWQDVEARRRKEKERRMRRIQFENGERGELHPRCGFILSLQEIEIRIVILETIGKRVTPLRYPTQ